MTPSDRFYSRGRRLEAALWWGLAASFTALGWTAWRESIR